MKKTLLLTACCLVLATMAQATTTLKSLKVNNLTTPLGIDTPQPVFSWQVESSERGFVQQSYSISVSDAQGTSLWDTGTVNSSQQSGIVYAGTTLQSCKAYQWTLTVTGTNGESATQTSTFETAFLDASEWTGKWIHADGVAYQTLDPLVITFDEPVSCQYLRLNITELGLRASTDTRYAYAQLDEVEIYCGNENVAPTATFTASNTWTLADYGWSLSFINDGQIGSASRNGWTTTTNPSTPVTVTADLGAVRSVTSVKLGRDAGYNREVCIDRMKFDKEGNIIEVKPSK